MTYARTHSLFPIITLFILSLLLGGCDFFDDLVSDGLVGDDSADADDDDSANDDTGDDDTSDTAGDDDDSADATGDDDDDDDDDDTVDVPDATDGDYDGDTIPDDDEDDNGDSIVPQDQVLGSTQDTTLCMHESRFPWSTPEVCVVGWGFGIEDGWNNNDQIETYERGDSACIDLDPLSLYRLTFTNCGTEDDGDLIYANYQYFCNTYGPDLGTGQESLCWLNNPTVAQADPSQASYALCPQTVVTSDGHNAIARGDCTDTY